VILVSRYIVLPGVNWPSHGCPASKDNHKKKNSWVPFTFIELCGVLL